MTNKKIEALNIVKQVCGNAKLNLQEHQLVQQSILYLEKLEEPINVEEQLKKEIKK